MFLNVNGTDTQFVPQIAGASAAVPDKPERGGGVGVKETSKAKLNDVVRLRVGADLKSALRERAATKEMEGRKMSRLCRALLWAGLTGQETGKLDQAVAELERLRGNLARIGGNLNQVAYWLNSRHELKEKNLSECIKELRPALNECAGTVMELRDGLIQRIR